MKKEKLFDIKKVIQRSYPAVCGISERETIVKSKNVEKAIVALRKKGYYVVGMGLDKGPKKIWFTRPGAL